jgi:hypothetical protein
MELAREALVERRPIVLEVSESVGYGIDNCGRHNSLTIKRPARMASGRLSNLISSFVTPVYSSTTRLADDKSPSYRLNRHNRRTGTCCDFMVVAR